MVALTADTFFSPQFHPGHLTPFQDLPARKRLIWLASFPKSGNTWARLYFGSYLSGVDQADINDTIANNHQCNSPGLTAIIGNKPVSQLTANEQLRARVGVQRLLARNEQNLFVKTHSVVGDNRGHPFIDPQVTVASIHIVRNPLAVLPSFARHMNLDLDQAVMAMANDSMLAGGVTTDEGKDQVPVIPQSSWSAHTRSWIGAAKKLNVATFRYEDMRQKGPETFAKMTAHARIEVDEARVAKALGATDFETLKAQDLSKGFKERTRADQGSVFFRSGKVEGWRDELEEKHIRGTIVRHWDAMSQLDYIPEDYTEFYEDVKFKALESHVARGIDIGVYAKDLNELRAKRGLQARLAINSQKTAVGKKESRKDKSKARPARKRTFG